MSTTVLPVYQSYDADGNPCDLVIICRSAKTAVLADVSENGTVSPTRISPFILTAKDLADIDSKASEANCTSSRVIWTKYDPSNIQDNFGLHQQYFLTGTSVEAITILQEHSTRIAIGHYLLTKKQQMREGDARRKIKSLIEQDRYADAKALCESFGWILNDILHEGALLTLQQTFASVHVVEESTKVRRSIS